MNLYPDNFWHKNAYSNYQLDDTRCDYLQVVIEPTTYQPRKVSHRFPSMWQSEETSAHCGTYQTTEPNDLILRKTTDEFGNVDWYLLRCGTKNAEVFDYIYLIDELKSEIFAINPWMEEWFQEFSEGKSLPLDIFPEEEDIAYTRKEAVIRTFLSQYGISEKVENLMRIPNASIDLTPSTYLLRDQCNGLPTQEYAHHYSLLKNEFRFTKFYLSNCDYKIATRLSIGQKILDCRLQQPNTAIDYLRQLFPHGPIAQLLELPMVEFDHEKIMQFKYLVRIAYTVNLETRQSDPYWIFIDDLQAPHEKIDEKYIWKHPRY